MKDELKRIRDDATTLVQFLDEALLLREIDDETEIRWIVEQIRRFNTNIEEAIGRIESGKRSIRGEITSQERQVPTQENSSPSERNELLRRQQPNSSAQGSSIDDERSDSPKDGTERRKAQNPTLSDPNYLL